MDSAKENNKWQREIVKIKEDAEKYLKALNTRLMKLEFQIEDLNLLNSQYMLKVQWLEKESQLKSDKLQEMHEKSLQAAIQVTGSKKAFAFQHQHLVIASLVPPASVSQNAANQSQVGLLRHRQPHDVDMLQVADQRSAGLKSEVDALKLANEQAEELVNSLKRQVEVTKSENERLTRLTNDRQPCNCSCPQTLEVDRPQRLSHDLDEESVNADLEGRAPSSNLSKQSMQLKLKLNDFDKVAQAPKKWKEELADVAVKKVPKAKSKMTDGRRRKLKERRQLIRRQQGQQAAAAAKKDMVM